MKTLTITIHDEDVEALLAYLKTLGIEDVKIEDAPNENRYQDSFNRVVQQHREVIKSLL